MADRRLVIATGNLGKQREFEELLNGAGVHLIPFETEVEENGETYSANARLKAETAANRTTIGALGDDSGIEVDALHGFPGIYSARIGPTQKARTEALLAKLDGVNRPWYARFVCVLALAIPGRPTDLFRGECTGEVVPEWRGEAGFGYDPIFLVPSTGKTFGEMTAQEKHQHSHRAAAVRALLASGALNGLSV